MLFNEKTHLQLYLLMTTLVREGHFEEEKGESLIKLLEAMEVNVNQIAQAAENILNTAHKSQDLLSDDELEE